jgi:acetylornithine deacetylase/succinyl-diaminopimelate desuccinylase-like protein
MAGFRGLARELELVDLLCELVSINSVNPDLKGGTGEAAMGEFVAGYLSDLGCEVWTQEVLPGRSNVFGKLPVGSADRTLLFDAHMDTIPLEPMPDALAPRVADGRVYGRGSCDTKGSLAGMLYAFKMLGERRDEIDCSPILMATVDDEYKARGIHSYVRTNPELDGAVVGEPTSLVPVIVHKGCLRWEIHTIGKAAHSSKPHEGNNAIYQMVEVINQLRAQIESNLLTKAHPMAGPPTMVVGVIRGGLQVNVVPDSCYIDIDRRIVPGEDPDDLLAEVDEVLRRVGKENPDFNIVRKEPSLVDPPLDASPDSDIARAALAACNNVLGGGELGAVDYGSHASTLNAVANIPAIVLGAGSIDQAHSANEWVSIDELVKGAELYAEICRVFGRS